MTVRPLRRSSAFAILAAVVAACAWPAGAAHAQGAAGAKPADFPEKAIRIIVPFPAASPPDILVRTLVPSLTTRFGKPILVENRPGANGNIGTEYLVNSPADGYTLMAGGLTVSTAEIFYKNLRFDVKRDLMPVTNFGVFPSVMIVGANSPFKSATELLDHLRKNPGQTYASYGRGGSPHLAGEQLRALAKVDITHIPFATTDPVLDVAAGRVTFMFVPGAAAMAKKDIVRALGVASAQREAMLPDLPTMDELGLKGFRMEAWNGVWAPKGTPTDRLDYLNRQINEAMNEPENRAKLNGAGMRIIGGTRAQMQTYFELDIKRWQDLAKAVGIQPD